VPVSIGREVDVERIIIGKPQVHMPAELGALAYEGAAFIVPEK